MNVAASSDYVVPALLIGLAGLEGAAFLLFAHDKAAAREHRRRVPERSLLWAAVWGGIGAWLACQMLRHKTRKEPFRTLLAAAGLGHLVAVGLGVWWMAG